MLKHVLKRNTTVNKHLGFSFNENQTIKLCQWNILAQGFVPENKFLHCSPDDLTLEKRKEMFKNEFNNISADIYCFQEADIHSILLDILNENYEKYFDIFASKMFSSCLTYPNNYGADGCAIVYNKEKFECLDQSTFIYEESGSHLCLFAVFCFISDTNLKFILACTHLKAERSFKDVRLNQCSNMLTALESLMMVWDTTIAFICGDLNATPDEEAITTIKDSHLNLVNVYDELKNESKVKQHYTTWIFKNNLSLSKRKSSLSSSQSDNERSDVIDYIWYTNSLVELLKTHSADNRPTVHPVSILDVPDKNEIGNKGIPVPDKYPSDHMSLVATFVMNYNDLT